MQGQEMARLHLGLFEHGMGNVDRAMKHFVISAKVGHDDSLEEVRKGFMGGHVSKDVFVKSSTSSYCKDSVDAMKSAQREDAGDVWHD